MSIEDWELMWDCPLGSNNFGGEGMKKRDYYDVLGIPKKASDQDIKKAYRKLAKKYHPDTNQGDQRAEQIFKEVTEAYNVLSDEEKRRLYDQFGHAAFDGSMGSNPEDFANAYEQHFRSADDGSGTHREYYYSGSMDDMFDDMFGSFFRHRQSSGPFHSSMDFDFEDTRSSDITSELTVSFKEAALGCEKRISFDTGTMGAMEVKIPAGIAEGQSIRLKGKGKSSRNGKAGDLLIQIHIRKDHRFTREGQDVYITEHIPFTTAALGGEINVDTLYGIVRCKVPAGSQSGSKLRLKNKGIVSMKNPHSYGDEYVILQIDVPKNLSEREKALLKELQEIRNRKTA